MENQPIQQQGVFEQLGITSHTTAEELEQTLSSGLERVLDDTNTWVRPYSRTAERHLHFSSRESDDLTIKIMWAGRSVTAIHGKWTNLGLPTKSLAINFSTIKGESRGQVVRRTDYRPKGEKVSYGFGSMSELEELDWELFRAVLTNLQSSPSHA